ncbi:hypothetical protein [Thiocystis violascens]|uniref:DUF29 domain-containing protein n=1 Tax=Thiocystis violascens (strain ATCC 17096 / DSM 198 / 6111) TaxID=765911 RepID=I3YAN0_THIV6|nr:hypothetical protein [Thiocystis violascens]AFL74048.1 hypothetical protein Thivi_2095 [Thiocystis violascens DSM 198]
MTHLATLYQTDYAQWAQRNAELLRARRFEEQLIISALASAWDDGRDLAIRETGLDPDPDRFPEDILYRLEQSFDPDSWPPASSPSPFGKAPPFRRYI